MFQFTQDLKASLLQKPAKRHVGILPAYSHSSVPLGEIDTISLEILDPDDLKASAVMEVTEQGAYSKNKPKPGGVYDPRLGPIDRSQLCAYGQVYIERCPGHWGYIDLAMPIYHIFFIGTILQCLHCVCYYCSKLMLPVTHPKYRKIQKMDPTKRLGELAKLCEKIEYCGGPPPKGEEDAKVEGNLKDIQKNGCHNLQPLFELNKKNKLVILRWARYVRREGKVATKARTTKFAAMDKKVKTDGWKAEHRSYIQKMAEKYQLEEGKFKPGDARDILRRISPETKFMLGFEGRSHPKNMIMTLYPVSPPMARMINIGSDRNKQRSDTDATKMLQRITSYSNSIYKKQEQLQTTLTDGRRKEILEEIDETFHKLQAWGAAYIDNDVTGVARLTSHTKVPLKSIVSNWSTKGGLMRGLGAKRVDFCARTVISPGPELDVNEIGVPMTICRTLTVPERVTRFNIDKLTKAVYLGPDHYPGANKIVTKDGAVLDLSTLERAKVELNYGDVVERHLGKGDVVLVNRQPTLHRLSFMAHLVVPISGKSFTLSLGATPSYNADFDGDEMNLHVPQTEEARAEAYCLMNVEQMIGCKNKIALVQDALIACYKSTSRDTFFTPEEFQQLIYQTRYFELWSTMKPLPVPAIRTKNKKQWSYLYTGKQLFSFFFPDTVQVGNHIVGLPLVESKSVLVRDGELLIGRLSKQTMGCTGTSIVQQLVYDHGVRMATKFVSDLQRVTSYWISEHGYGIRLSDCIAPHPKEVKAIQEKAIAFLSTWDHPDPEVKETYTQNVLRIVRDEVGRLCKSKGPNNMTDMVTSGAKGSNVNELQIKGESGQIYVNGLRMIRNYGTDRCLPHFLPGDNNPEAQGYIPRSFMQGHTPIQSFFHAQGGREGLVYTANKTAPIGYLTRRMTRATEDITVKEDHTVRDLSRIVVFLFGDDNLDPDWLETQHHPCLEWSKQEIIRQYDGEKIDWTKHGGKPKGMVLRRELYRIVQDVKAVRNTKLRFFHDELDTSIKSPVNFTRYLQNAQARSFKTGDHPLTAGYIIQKREQLLTDVKKLISYETPLLMLSSLFNVYLSFRSLLQKHRLDKVGFDWLIDNIFTRIRKAMIQPGTPIGITSAQSLGEPSTQMTLNTFHLAGVGNKNTSKGIARMDEMIRGAEDISNPSVEIYPLCDISKDLIYRPLGFFIERTQILIESDPEQPLFDHKLVECFYTLSDPPEIGPYSALVLRIVLDKKRLISHGFTIVDVAEKLKRKYGHKHHWLRSSSIMDEWIIRLRILTTSPGIKKLLEKKKGKGRKLDISDIYLAYERTIRRSIHMSGISEIEGFEVEQRDRLEWDKNLVVVPVKEAVISTIGSNLREILNLRNIDAKRTITNNIQEVAQVLGIEAASLVFLREMQTLLRYHGTSVPYHYLHTTIAAMCRSGELVSMTRFGFNQDRHYGFIRRCSFEEIRKNIADSAKIGEVDQLRGNTSNLVFGKPIPIGTHAFGLVTPPYQPLKPKEEDRLMDPLENLDCYIPYLEARKVGRVTELKYSSLGQEARTQRLNEMCESVIPDYSDWLPKVTKEVTLPLLGQLALPSMYHPMQDPEVIHVPLPSIELGKLAFEQKYVVLQ